jgi:outer membrane protein
MFYGLRVELGWLVLFILTLTACSAQDVFETKRAIPVTPASPVLQGMLIPLGPVGNPLSLQEAIGRALNNNPKTRQQWANIMVQAAGVGIGYSAYLPTLSGTVQGNREVSTTEVTGYPQLNSDTWAYTNTESLSLSWVLYDFGGRAGALKNAEELLVAAQANHEVTLREVFAAVAKDYYSAQAAQGGLNTARDNAETARNSFTVASSRVEKGVSPISDKLQADTALMQANVDLTKAEGDLQVANGTLAVDMGLRPDQPIRLPDVDLGVRPDAIFEESVTQLINEAISLHPSVREAEAQFIAAEAKVRQVRAQALPSLSFVAKTDRAEEPLNEEVGVSSFKATETDSYVGAQINIPLFDGFSTDYQVRQARAQVEVQRYMLQDARQQVGLDVWTSYQAMQEAAKNLQNTADLMKISKQSYLAAEKRYESGVGSMIERLTAQSDLATARFEWIKALTDWRTSRLVLATKIGTMGTWWLKEK